MHIIDNVTCFAFPCILLLLLWIIITHCHAQTSRPIFVVNRVFADTNSLILTISQRRELAPILQFWSKSCEVQFPTLLNFATNFTIISPTGSDGTCDSMPLSVFVRPTREVCSAVGCSTYDSTAGGGLGGGFEGNQIAAPGSGSLPSSMNHQYVSITTYSAQESTPGNVAFPMGTEQTNILYCPGSAALTSSFLFKTGACVLAPNSSTTNTVNDRDWNGSMRIFLNYRAFYALCGVNGGLLIKGCEDDNCQNCFVITNSFGCTQYLPDSLTGYINYQGCGIGLSNTNNTS